MIRIATARSIVTGRRIGSARGGFSLLEMTIVTGILGLMLGGIAMIVDTSKNAFVSGSNSMRVDGEGNRVMGRVIEILRGAQSSTLAPTPAPPASSPQIDFQTSLGAQPGGLVALDDTQRIRFVPGQGRVEWVHDLGLPSEVTVSLVRGVPDLLEGEVLNNLDDNGNGLEDEPGFCFVLEGNVLRVLMTLERPGPEGTVFTRTFEARLFSRN